MLADAWHTLYAAVRQHCLATTGIYARIPHPQYVAFFMYGRVAPVAAIPSA